MAFALTGCLGLHLGVGRRHPHQRPQSIHKLQLRHHLGQQLEDLNKAYEQGIITKSEYDRERKRLLKYYLPR